MNIWLEHNTSIAYSDNSFACFP